MMISRQVLWATGVLAAGGLWGCGPGTPSVAATPEGSVIADERAQRVTRTMAAVPAKIAAAAMQVFSERGIPIATSNEATGTVTGSPLRLSGTWNGQQTSERVTCGMTSGGQPIASMGTTQLTVALEAKGNAQGSTATLIAAGRNNEADQDGATGTEQGCILTAAFASALLDDIERRATGAMGAGARPDTTAPDTSPAVPPAMPTDTTKTDTTTGRPR